MQAHSDSDSDHPVRVLTPIEKPPLIVPDVSDADDEANTETKSTAEVKREASKPISIPLKYTTQSKFGALVSIPGGKKRAGEEIPAWWETVAMKLQLLDTLLQEAATISDQVMQHLTEKISEVDKDFKMAVEVYKYGEEDCLSN
jgi:hypothetical protein